METQKIPWKVEKFSLNIEAFINFMPKRDCKNAWKWHDALV